MAADSHSRPDFQQVGLWCQEYLTTQHSEAVGQAFAKLLASLADIEWLGSQPGQDQFDLRRSLEREVDCQLRQLALAHADSLDARVQSRGKVESLARSSTARSNIFVYGTLKRGNSRAAALAGQQFLGSAQTEACYRMYDCGGYPGLVPADDGLPIAGEVWSVDQACVAALDEIEGVSLNLYRRQPVALQGSNDEFPVEAYLYCRSTSGLPDCGSSW